MYFSLYTEFTLVAADCYWMLKQTRCMYSRALHCTAAHSESDEEWRVEYFIVADLLFPGLSLNALLTQWTRFVTPLIGRGWLEMGLLRNMKYENGGNQRSRAAPQIRRVLSRPKNDRFWRVFYPIPHIFFAFSPFPRTHKTNFEEKNQALLAFLAVVEAQTFCLNSGRVATAYSTDKYKYQKMRIRVSWVEQWTLWPLSN